MEVTNFEFARNRIWPQIFNSQLPSLIKALERIAESLSAPKQSLSADFVADPDFLHDLYYGDYEPSVFKTQSEHQKQLNHNASMAEELLRQKWAIPRKP